jgi:hypothetical protein
VEISGGGRNAGCTTLAPYVNAQMQVTTDATIAFGLRTRGHGAKSLRTAPRKTGVLSWAVAILRASLGHRADATDRLGASS